MSVSNFEKVEKHFESILKNIPIQSIITGVEKSDRAVFFRYFKGYRPSTIGRKKIAEILKDEIYNKKNENISDLLILLWNNFNRDIYHAMLESVKTINEDVEKIERIEDEKAGDIISNLLKTFSKDDIYLCVRFNEVKFSEEIIEKMLLELEPMESKNLHPAK